MAKGRKIGAKIASCAGFPDDTLGGVSYVSVYGKNKVTVEECEAVVECCENVITARVCDGVVQILGESLVPVDFRLKTLSVCGTIKEIRFESKEMAEKT